MRMVVVATDGSACAGRAVDVAAGLAKDGGASLLVLTVGGNAASDEVRAIAKAEGNAPEALDLMANRILDEARRRAAALGLEAVRVQTAWGDPAAMIIEVARSERADAIVVGRRGHGQLVGLLLGSVSQKLVTLAPCAVVVVP